MLQMLLTLHWLNIASSSLCSWTLLYEISCFIWCHFSELVLHRMLLHGVTLAFCTSTMIVEGYVYLPFVVALVSICCFVLHVACSWSLQECPISWPRECVCLDRTGSSSCHSHSVRGVYGCLVVRHWLLKVVVTLMLQICSDIQQNLLFMYVWGNWTAVIHAFRFTLTSWQPEGSKGFAYWVCTNLSAEMWSQELGYGYGHLNNASYRAVLRASDCLAKYTGSSE